MDSAQCPDRPRPAAALRAFHLSGESVCPQRAGGSAPGRAGTAHPVVWFASAECFDEFEQRVDAPGRDGWGGGEGEGAAVMRQRLVSFKAAANSRSLAKTWLGMTQTNGYLCHPEQREGSAVHWA